MIDSSQNPRISASLWPWIFTFLIALSGTGISFWLWRARTVTERNAVKEEFHLEAQNLQSLIAQEIQLFMDVLNSIRQLHNISDQINARDFEEFVNKGMSYQKRILQGFGFVQRTSHETRQLMQKPGTNSLQPTLVIQESDGQNGFKPVPDKPEYYALTYQTPAGSMNVPNGFDFSSTEPYLNAIHHMIEFGEVSLGGKLPDSASDYYVFAPILYSEFQGHPVAPPGYLIGFAVAIFRPEQIVRHIAEIQAAHNLKIDLINPNNHFLPSAAFQNAIEGNRYPPLFALAPLRPQSQISRNRMPMSCLFPLPFSWRTNCGVSNVRRRRAIFRPIALIGRNSSFSSDLPSPRWSRLKFFS